MPSPGLSELVTTTLRNRSATLADNVSDNTALLFKLRERGNRKPFSGGRTIVQGLFYAENGTYTRYSSYDTINITPRDVITAAEFEIKQAAVSVSISGLEQLQNAGQEQLFDLLDERITNAESTMINNLSSDIYSDGTANSGKQVGGLQALVSDAGTGTVGGINSSTYSFWQNSIYDFSTEGVTASATTMQRAMNTLWLRTKRNNDMVDLWVGDNTYFQYYWESLQPIQRVASAKMADAGFRTLEFLGSPVIPDGGQGGDAPSAHMYGLNTKYIFYRPHRQRDMVPLDPDRFSTNQDAMVKLIAWAGNMTVSNRALQGVIVA